MKYHFFRAFILFCFLVGAVPANAAIPANAYLKADPFVANVWAFSESEKFINQFSLTVNLLLIDIPDWVWINAGGSGFVFDPLIDDGLDRLPFSPFSGSVLHRLPPIRRQK